MTTPEERTLDSLTGACIVRAEKVAMESDDGDYEDFRLHLDDGRMVSALTSAADDCDSWFFVTERRPIAARVHQ